MTLTVLEEDNTFRVEWQGNSTDWLPDTPSNRKAMLLFLCSVQDEKGKALFTFQELSVLFDSDNPRDAGSPADIWRDSGNRSRANLLFPLTLLTYV